MVVRRDWRGLAIWALTLVAAGCGGAVDDGEQVTGSVTKGGAGVAGVLVIFSHQATGNFKGANTDASGAFQLKLPPGTYQVVLSKKVDAQGNPPAEGQDTDELEETGQLRESIPPQYSNPAAPQFSAEVPKGGIELPPFVIE